MNTGYEQILTHLLENRDVDELTFSIRPTALAHSAKQAMGQLDKMSKNSTEELKTELKAKQTAKSISEVVRT